jgi:hypothetical protein
MDPPEAPRPIGRVRPRPTSRRSRGDLRRGHPTRCDSPGRRGDDLEEELREGPALVSGPDAILVVAGAAAVASSAAVIANGDIETGTFARLDRRSERRRGLGRDDERGPGCIGPQHAPSGNDSALWDMSSTTSIAFRSGSTTCRSSVVARSDHTPVTAQSPGTRTRTPVRQSHRDVPDPGSRAARQGDALRRRHAEQLCPGQGHHVRPASTRLHPARVRGQRATGARRRVSVLLPG